MSEQAAKFFAADKPHTDNTPARTFEQLDTQEQRPYLNRVRAMRCTCGHTVAHHEDYTIVVDDCTLCDCRMFIAMKGTNS